MRFLVLVSTFFAVTSAAPQGYSLPTPAGPAFPVGGCGDGEVLNVDGSCAIPQITRNVFVYTAQAQPASFGPPPPIPPPRQEYNIMFIRVPEAPQRPDPIIVGPPEQKSVVYVLSKHSDALGQRVIEVPAPPPASPQVYFVNYGEGENPTLPGGIDLQTALGSASAAGSTVIGGGGGLGGAAALGGAGLGGAGGAGLGGAGFGGAGLGGAGGAGLGGAGFGGAGGAGLGGAGFGGAGGAGLGGAGLGAGLGGAGLGGAGLGGAGLGGAGLGGAGAGFGGAGAGFGGAGLGGAGLGGATVLTDGGFGGGFVDLDDSIEDDGIIISHGGGPGFGGQAALGGPGGFGGQAALGGPGGFGGGAIVTPATPSGLYGAP